MTSRKHVAVTIVEPSQYLGMFVTPSGLKYESAKSPTAFKL